MTDMNDRASALEEQTRERALAAQVQRAGLIGKTIEDSRQHCLDCGDDIPEERRHAMLGCKRCTHCQEIREKDFYER
ncbi:TraR/DksA C4-type zinc finger protein [Undibacterium danionis]|uniref:TraR/DksA C4-type zinc finger protein n=1 Tax=Undibacterium danionis TaxID=1812100 RepID=A0ABV6IDM2_9BURK